MVKGCNRTIDWKSRNWGYWSETYKTERDNVHLAWREDMQAWGRTERCGESWGNWGKEFIYCRECIVKAGLIW